MTYKYRGETVADILETYLVEIAEEATTKKKTVDYREGFVAALRAIAEAYNIESNWLEIKIAKLEA